jgi:hypothetical protein
MFPIFFANYFVSGDQLHCILNIKSTYKKGVKTKLINVQTYENNKNCKEHASNNKQINTDALSL